MKPRVLLALVLLPAAPLAAQDPALLTLDRIITRADFATRSFGPAHWLADGSGFAATWPSSELKGARDIVRWNVTDGGAREVLVSARQLIPPGAERPLAIADYDWSNDGSKVLIFTNTRRVWRYPTRGDYWVLDLEGKKLIKLGATFEPSSLLFAKFSPDGKRVGYVHGHDLYVETLGGGEIERLTSDGGEHRINGTFDWVYEEELDLRDGFRWSPDGRWIAYWQLDTSGVGTFYLIDNTAGVYQKLRPIPYPKVGTTNPAARVGIISAAGGPTRWIELQGDPREHYIASMDWDGSDEIALQRLNRRQNTNRVFLADRRTGKAREILCERDEAWVDVRGDLRWLADGEHFLWVSERDGWRHVYLASRAGGEPKLLTPDEFDAIEVAGLDEDGGWLYFIASPHDPGQRYLYRAPLDGSGESRRVTPEDLHGGTHSYQLSACGRWAIHTRSRFGEPPTIEIVSLPDAKVHLVLENNLVLHRKLSALRRGPVEFFRVDIGGGVLLDGWCMKPPDFNPARRYPVLFHVYGEPWGQTVLDRWGGMNYLWHLMLTQRGYIVMSIDNRGTPAPRGRAWRKCIYRQVGILAPADQAAAVRAIIRRWAWVDPTRIGIWGWSGGGSMSLHAIFRYPELYQCAMAVAFIADQRTYDTIYQERYMGLPSENAAGYRDGSPITWAQQLRGDLLLVYGTGDDNCHYQNMELLVNRLIAAGRPFSMMAYPNRSHGIYEGAGTRRHLYGLLTRYLREHLPAGAR